MPAFSAVIALNVRAERSRMRLTQTQLGELIHWSAQMVSETETGQRRIGVDDMLMFCRIFKVTLRELARGADPEDFDALGI